VRIGRIRLTAGLLVALAVIVGAVVGLPVATAFAQSSSGPSTAIAEIRVSGSQRIEPETVRSYMNVKVGDRFNSARIDRSLKALFATGLFADVRMRRQGNVLVVSVVENPIINRLAFEGNARIDDPALEAEVQLRPRVVYTRARVQSDVQRIIDLYRRSGRFAATVEPKVIQLEQNRVDLVFEISEGEVTEIAKIRFVGNRAFSDGQLRSALATKESRWYRFLTSNDTYDPDRLTLDRELLRKHYLSRGYADFRVNSAVAELTADRSSFFITITVEEGELYTFGDIEIDTELRDLDGEQLQSFVVTPTGDLYDAELVEDTVQNLTFELGRLGYAFVDIRPRVDRDKEERTISLTFEIKEGPRVYVERIDIEGNVRTLDKVIRREFRLAEGDAFNTAKLRRSRARIRGLGFFDKVSVSNQPGSAQDRTVIEVEVQEQSTGELSFGAGVSTSENVVGEVSIRERNLLGRGQDLRLSFSISTRRQELDLAFTEPYFLDKPVSAGFDIFNRETDFQDRSSFDESSLGFRLRAGYRITERLRQQVHYELRQDEISDVDSSASNVIKQQEGTDVTSAVGYRLTYDRRDDPQEPTKGYIFRMSQNFAGFGGDVRYIRSSIRFAQYFPVTSTVIAAIKWNEGYIFGLGQDVSISDRFFVGGESFKGFESGGVGPRDVSTDDSLGGNLFYVGTAEVRFPLGLPSEFDIVGRFFAQAGSLADVDDDDPNIFDKGSVRASAGFGVSWGSPFGPIRLDFTEAFIKEDVDKTEFFRFSFGTRF